MGPFWNSCSWLLLQGILSSLLVYGLLAPTIPQGEHLFWQQWWIWLLLLGLPLIALGYGIMLTRLHIVNNTAEVRPSRSTSQFLQRCRASVYWQEGRVLHGVLPCRVFGKPTERVLVYLHPYPMQPLSAAVIRQLIDMLCRYDCQKLRIFSYAGVDPSAMGLVEAVAGEVIDHQLPPMVAK